MRCHNRKFVIILTTTKDKDLNGIHMSFQHGLHISTLSMRFHKMEIDLSLTILDLVSLTHTEINGYVSLLPEVSIRNFLPADEVRI